MQLEVVTDGESRIDATAKAYGVKGGSGKDVIVNTGTVTATGTATAISRDISVEALGMSSMNAATTAEATATGIDGGKGADAIENTGTVKADATSTANALGVDVKYKGIPLDLFGVKVGDSRTASRASAVGIKGGAGDDTITNTGSVNVTAKAYVETDKISAQVSFPLTGSTAVMAAGAPAAAAWSSRCLNRLMNRPRRRCRRSTAGPRPKRRRRESPAAAAPTRSRTASSSTPWPIRRPTR